MQQIRLMHRRIRDFLAYSILQPKCPGFRQSQGLIWRQNVAASESVAQIVNRVECKLRITQNVFCNAFLISEERHFAYVFSSYLSSLTKISPILIPVASTGRRLLIAANLCSLLCRLQIHIGLTSVTVNIKLTEIAKQT